MVLFCGMVEFWRNGRRAVEEGGGGTTEYLMTTGTMRRPQYEVTITDFAQLPSSHYFVDSLHNYDF